MIRSIILMILLTLVGCNNQTTSSTSPPSTATVTPNPVDITATAFVAAATQTGIAVTQNLEAMALRPSNTPESGACTPSVSNVFDGQASEEIQAAFEVNSIKNIVISVVATERIQDCAAATVIETLYLMDITLENATPDAEIGTLTAEILGVLVNFPPQSTQPLQLTLRFTENNRERSVEVEYRAAMRALNDGLEGVELLQALSGLR